MAEITLEAVLARLEALERKVAEQSAQHAPPVRKKDWRRVAGMFTDSDLMREIDAEGQAIREADREAGREGRPE